MFSRGLVVASSCGKSDVIHRAVRRLRPGYRRNQIPYRKTVFKLPQRIRIRRSVRRVKCMQGVPPIRSSSYIASPGAHGQAVHRNRFIGEGVRATRGGAHDLRTDKAPPLPHALRTPHWSFHSSKNRIIAGVIRRRTVVAECTKWDRLT